MSVFSTSYVAPLEATSEENHLYVRASEKTYKLLLSQARCSSIGLNTQAKSSVSGAAILHRQKEDASEIRRSRAPDVAFPFAT
jgi:hypothetical protein